MTRQEIFNVVWKTFVVEKAPRGLGPLDGACAYITDSGTRCAVGVLLDAWEARAMQKDTNAPVTTARNLPLRFEEHRDFLAALQDMHDTAWNPVVGETEEAAAENRGTAARELAREWVLDVPV